MKLRTFSGFFLEYEEVEMVAYVFRNKICEPETWNIIIDTPEGMELMEESFDTSYLAFAFANGYASAMEDEL